MRCFWTTTEIWDETVKRKRGQPEPTRTIEIWVPMCGADRPEDCSCDTLNARIERMARDLRIARKRAKDLEAMADREMHRGRELLRVKGALWHAQRELEELRRAVAMAPKPKP